MRKVAAVIAVIVLTAVVLLSLSACNSAIEPDLKLKEQTVNDRDGDENNLRVGIISDTQLPGSQEELEKPDGARYYENLLQAFRALKDQNCEMILMAGDICQDASDFAYQLYLKARREIYGDDAPLNLFIMGNHDYWFDGDHGSRKPKQQMFMDNLGVNPFTHYKVNGFHFIAWSPDHNKTESGYDKKYCKMLEREIEKAEADTPGMPVFVMTHQNPSDTVYGSDAWGDRNLGETLEGHEQVVNLSGHSHYDILDERSIWQGSFTAFSTQSIAYLDCERTMYNPATDSANGTHPLAEARPMGLIMDVTAQQTLIRRINLYEKDADGKYGFEERAESRWSLSHPISADNFTYRPEQVAARRNAPIFADDADIRVVDDVPVYADYSSFDAPLRYMRGLEFNAADNYNNGNKGYVSSYRFQFVQNDTVVREYECYADAFLGEKAHRSRAKIGVAPDLPAGNYTVRIYARDCYGKLSAPVIGEIVW